MSDVFTVARRTLLAAAVLLPSPLVAQSVTAYRGATIETATDQGTLDGATILVRDGKIQAVGQDLEIPITARVVDWSGKTVLPGFVDPYYVVDISGLQSGPSFREVTFGGRTFRIPTSPAAAPTDYTRIVDGFDPRSEDWDIAARSGITTAHLVARGVGLSAFGDVRPDDPKSILVDPNGRLFLALTNQSSSLKVLREGLKEPPERSRGSTASQLAEARQRGERGGGPGGRMLITAEDDPKPEDESEAAEKSETASKLPTEAELWASVRKGELPIFVNVNNAATILYLTEELDEAAKTRLALVAGGDDLYRTLDSLDAERTTIVMPPRIDLIPESRDRVNVARMLHDKEFKLAFSLSLNQGDFRQTQESPLFPVAMLVRSGLDRQTAIRALTRVPAELLGVEKEVGTIEKGRRANFVVFDEDPLSATASIIQVMVDGSPIYEN